MRLKIERVEVFGVAMPLVGEYKNAYLSKSSEKRGRAHHRERGRGRLRQHRSVARLFQRDDRRRSCACSKRGSRRACTASIPTNIHRVLEAMPALEGFLDAKAAIEMACVDLDARVARHAGPHLSRRRREGHACTSTPGSASCRRTRPRRETRAWHGAASARPRSRSAATSTPTAIASRAVREAVGPRFQLRIDANAGYDAETSIRLARLVAPFNLQLVRAAGPGRRSRRHGASAARGALASRSWPMNRSSTTRA